MKNQGLIQEIRNFKASDKSEYEETGCSDKKVIELISNWLDKASDHFIDLYQISTNPSKKKKEAIIGQALDDILNGDLDTDDKEFAYDCMSTLSKIVGIDLNKVSFPSLNESWDDARASFQVYQDARKAVPFINRTCLECGTEHKLEYWNIPSDHSSGWFITECESCHYIDYIKLPEGANSYYLTGFNWIEYLNDTDFFHDFAANRAEKLNIERGFL